MEHKAFAFDENLDSDFLYSLYGDDTDHAAMMFNEFLASVPSLMGEIEQSYCDNEIENFRQKVHKVKPVFSFVGLTQMTRKAEILEGMCSDLANTGVFRETYEELKIQYSKSMLIIEREANRLQHQTF